MHIVPNLPVGLVHGDFHPGNMGWRKKSKELVVFDFERGIKTLVEMETGLQMISINLVITKKA
jgi:Ser/Thr protein kinase RdoA (MazF antagonist)